ncbi:subtilisin family serine protease [Mycolicibacterium sp. BK556]|uniref:S8 family peptidase n=1 Tax=Mycobacteriaceae TaxID=1762 RepID=UPI00105D5D2D|nr:MULTISPECIES: S8 family serine peptidase [Mycobacteriaceae]MBB3603355.1 subtilisin family serine protease [Mycolicibacterium sp. BK556]MBB3633550.1 subtilisin family serine protease [Mycolicibacterium sp. BK607]MBB3751132.1 subtilisin family serine protease [Mycolicibacterium sp. BK634]TDO11669.1 subtilase family protein [Mycobacterium sp. BK086]
MPKIQVLLEVSQSQDEAFAAFDAELASPSLAVAANESALDKLAGLGVEMATDLPPVPMLNIKPDTVIALEAFGVEEVSPDMSADTVVVAAEVDAGQIDALQRRRGVTVWANSPLEFVDGCRCGTSPDVDATELFDLASSAGGVDCSPFLPAVTVEAIRTLLGVRRIWHDGFRGQNVVVGIIDEGVNGMNYPVVGGFSRPNALRPGTADITSHGSMCAADVLVAAPAAKLYDYPFLGIQNSGGALQMFQAALTQRHSDGTPHVLNNSWGFTAVPDQQAAPNHEIWNLDHPLHRKIREVITSGATTMFAAGNCGQDCPSGNCRPSGIGPGRSIHGSNSLAEVITVAAVNSRNQRIGYSSQGPGMFEHAKPDVAAYSHFFGNFGPGRPGGTAHSPFDNGTSCATPVASGVAALLLSAFPQLTPVDIRNALIAGAVNIGPPGFDDQTGHGVINAAASYANLRASR